MNCTSQQQKVELDGCTLDLYTVLNFGKFMKYCVKCCWRGLLFISLQTFVHWLRYGFVLWEPVRWITTDRTSPLFCFGLFYCGTFAALHETVHNTAFKSQVLNKVASITCGIVQLYPASIFRELHFTHHRFTHIPGKDPEISIGNKPAPSVVDSPLMFIGWHTGLPLLLFKIGFDNWAPGSSFFEKYIIWNLYSEVE